MTTTHIGVDVGGTTTDAVLVDERGRILHRHTRPSGHGAPGVVAEVVASVDVLTDQAGVAGPPASFGVGMPGTVVDGVVRGAQNLGIERLDLAAALGDRWGTRPVVDNDVNAAALGAWIDLGGSCRSLALLNLGTGLAAGFVLDGRVWRGARGGAGEIGHVSIDPNGPTGVGVPPGALEVYASGSGIARQAGGESAATVLARTDDADAARIRHGLHVGVANAVRLLVLTLDVEVVAIGGGLVRCGPDLVTGVSGVFDDWRGQSPLVDSLDLAARMRVLDPDRPLAAFGAAMRGAGHG